MVVFRDLLSLFQASKQEQKKKKKKKKKKKNNIVMSSQYTFMPVHLTLSR
jgi:hypothetical protein